MVTNIQAALLYKFLTSPVANELTMTLKGNLAVQRNIRGLKDFFESISSLESKYKTPSIGMQEFDRRKNELIMKHALKDKDENPIQTGGGLRIANVEAFNKDMEDLMNSSKDIIEEHSDKLKEWEEFAQGEVDVPVIMISESDVKFDKISKLDFEALSVMIKDLDLGEVEETPEKPEEDLEEAEEDPKE